VSKRRKQGPSTPKPREMFSVRPFAGLVDEPEWIALRELVPAAAAPLQLAPDVVERFGDVSVTLATVLPMAMPALRKADGRIFLGLQRHVQSGDFSRDLAVALACALEAEPGAPVTIPAVPGVGPRLQDLIVNAPLDITMHPGFDFWLDEGATDDPEVAASLERANSSLYPTARLAAAKACYWTQVPDKAHVRWVLPDDEDTALNALSRLSASGDLLLGPDTRFAGMFRACGLLVPVWDVPREVESGDWEAPVADLAKRLADALAVDAPLSSAERRARQGLLGRQVTLR
jgi:Family of unknown function (DUF5926)